jgi:hypothetical protein
MYSVVMLVNDASFVTTQDLSPAELSGVLLPSIFFTSVERPTRAIHTEGSADAIMIEVSRAPMRPSEVGDPRFIGALRTDAQIHANDRYRRNLMFALKQTNDLRWSIVLKKPAPQNDA